MSEIRLVVQADDFGMCAAVNAGIVRAFRDGIVTQAMLMAPCAWFPHAASLAREHGIPVGLHTTLTAEWPHLRWGPLTRAPSLSEPDGTFRRTIDAAVLHADAVEATAELRAQAERVLAAGLLPVLVDVHMGQVCEAATSAVCEWLGRPFLYPVGVPHLALDSFEVLSTVPARCKRDWLLDHLASLGPGSHYLQSHPGVPGPELSALTEPRADHAVWAEAFRASDLAALTDPRVRRLARERGIRLVSADALPTSPPARWAGAAESG